jgi:sec-independent protein translocase protein TatC
MLLERLLRRTLSEEPSDMTFFDHLEELRWQIVKAFSGFLVATIGCIFYAEFIVREVLLRPIREVGLRLQVLSPYGKVMLYMEAVIFSALIISMPWILWSVWKFVAPGLLPKERRYISRIVAFTSLCFFSGVAFAYIVLVPTALQFFASFGDPTIELNIAVDQYVSFMLVLILGAGLVFELPMVSYFLSKMGMLTPAFMRKYRRHAIVVILIVSAVITPTPDIITQVLLALPMFLLYEISILVSQFSNKKKEPVEPETTG